MDVSFLRQIRRKKCCLPGWFRREMVTVLKLSWPTAISHLLQQVLLFVSLAFSGHIDSTSSIPLDAAALAGSVISITGVTPALGMATALDTLAAQAWGAKSYHKVGIYLQRCILMFTLVMFPMYGLWFNIESVLNLLHQPPCVVELATEYIHIYSASLPAVFLYYLLQKYLQAQGIVWPFIFTAIAANIVSALSHYLLIFVVGMGIRGAATSVVLASYTFVGVTLLIIYIRKLHVKTWGGWSKESLRDWYQIVRYGFPGFLMIGVELWTFEIGIFVTGLLANSEVQQGIHGILQSYSIILAMMPISLAVALSIRMGNELGSGNVAGAKHAVVVGAVFFITGMCLTVLLILSLKTIAPRIFTSNPCLLDAISTPMFLLVLISSFDWVRMPLGGVLRGSGKQLLGSVINLFCYFVVAMPLGVVLTIAAGLGATGYWIGLTTGGLLQAVLYIAVLVLMSWRKESEKAQRMAGKEPEQFQESERSASEPAAAETNMEDVSAASEEDFDLGLAGPASKNRNKFGSSEEEMEARISDTEQDQEATNSSSVANITVSAVPVSTNLENNLIAAHGAEVDCSDEDHLIPNSGEDSSDNGEENYKPLSDSLVETAPSAKRIPLWTVVLRILTLVAMIVLLAVSVAVSQLYVYQSNIGPCLPVNSTLNATANITLAVTANTTKAHLACSSAR